MVNKTKPRILHNIPQEESWDIPEVPYRGKIITCRVYKNLTPAMNAEQLAKYYEKQKKDGNPYPTDSILTWNIFSKASDLDENSKTSELRNFFYKAVREFLKTSSIVNYNPFEEKDEAVHNYNTSDQYSLRENIAGPDGFITGIPDKKTLKSLLGKSNVNEINKTSQYLNETDMSIWRLIRKPTQKEKRVVRFYADGGRLGLYADWYLSNGVSCSSGIED